MSEQSKVERWMIDAAKGIDANVSTYLGFISAHPKETVINELAQIISRHAPAPVPNAESDDEDDEYSGEHDDDCDDERAFEQEQLELAECVCGAYHWSEKLGRFIQVADCCCGKA